MKKAEIEEKLTDIQQRLVNLGDLQSLVSQGATLPSLTSEALNTHATVQGLLTTLNTQAESFRTLLEEASSLNEQLAQKTTEVDEINTATVVLQEKTEELKRETLVQLGLAASEKLSNSFEQVKVDLVEEKDNWYKRLARSVWALLGLTLAITIWQVVEHGSLFHLNFVVKIILTSPLVYFVIFVNREYSRTKRLIEEYTFKAAIARSFEAYKEILEDAFKDQQDAVYQQKLDFILGAVKSLYSSPMQNIKLNSEKDKELSPDMISQLKSVLPPNS